MASSTKECEYMINELKRNASGYYDPTAYEAIRKVDAEMNINPGEIWEVGMNNGRMSTVAVLSVNDNIVSCVPLFETRRNDYEIEVKENGIMFANTAMVKYEYVNCFVSFIRLMKDEEFEKVREGVRKYLGFEACDSCSWDEAAIEHSNEQKAEIARLKEMLEEKVNTINVLSDKCAELEKTNEENMDFTALIRTKAERDLFKKLYEEAIERLLKAV